MRPVQCEPSGGRMRTPLSAIAPAGTREELWNHMGLGAWGALAGKVAMTTVGPDGVCNMMDVAMSVWESVVMLTLKRMAGKRDVDCLSKYLAHALGSVLCLLCTVSQVRSDTARPSIQGLRSLRKISMEWMCKGRVWCAVVQLPSEIRSRRDSGIVCCRRRKEPAMCQT